MILSSPNVKITGVISSEGFSIASLSKGTWFCKKIEWIIWERIGLKFTNKAINWLGQFRYSTIWYCKSFEITEVSNRRDLERHRCKLAFWHTIGARCNSRPTILPCHRSDSLRKIKFHTSYEQALRVVLQEHSSMALPLPPFLSHWWSLERSSCWIWGKL